MSPDDEFRTLEAEREMALLFTDVVDSTQLNEQIGDEAAARMWAAHDRAARELLRTWHGREIGRSDGFFMLFERCDQALGFALDYHCALATLQPPLRARVGLHWGAAALRRNDAADIAAGATPYEVDGLALPTAARVMSAAGGGQTLLSAAAHRALPPAALRSLRSCEHGHWRLKGLDAPVELFEVGPEHAVFAPPPDSAKAYRVAWRNAQWEAVASLPNNLGAEPDAFIGREADLQVLARTFDEGSRLVTLLGIGGIGKTRLALRYARGWLGSHPGGVWFCDLAPARGLDGIVHAVAQALELPLGSSDPVQQLAAALAARGDCLLLLDNFEQVARHAEATLGHWLRALPNVRFLVTSREVLGLPGERLQGLVPLSEDQAQALFLQRMRAAGLDSTLQAADSEALPALVRTLDCLPLAIELAASRARVMPPADQLKRIGERFWLLAGRGGRLDRQATLRATLDWSWDLLLPAEQRALAQLSVFEGGFTLAAMEAVVDLADCTPAPWVADVLQSLVEKSLVQRIHARRFALLRSVQDYAAEKLPSLDTQAAARHWRHFSAMSEAQAIGERCVELDNLATACRNATRAASVAPMSPFATTGQREAIDTAAVGALVNAAAALRLVGPFRAALELAQPLAARAELAPRLRAQVARVLATCCNLMGQTEVAQAHCREGLELARATGQGSLQAKLICMQAELDWHGGRFEAARTALGDALALADIDAPASLMVQLQLGNIAMAQSDLALAGKWFSKALRMAELSGDRRREGGLHGNLGSLAMLQGQPLLARPHLEQALQLAHEAGDRQWAGNAHCNLGLLLIDLGELKGAQLELDAALQMARATGHRRLEATALCNLGLLSQANGEKLRAAELLDQSARVAHASGSALLEGQCLGYLGELLADLQQREAAQGSLQMAEQLLVSSGDAQALMLLRCQQAVAFTTLEDDLAAAAALAQAELLASSLELAARSELERALVRARDQVSRRR